MRNGWSTASLNDLGWELIQQGSYIVDPSGAYNLDNVFKKDIEGGVVDTTLPIVEESYQKILIFVKLGIRRRIIGAFLIRAYHFIIDVSCTCFFYSFVAACSKDNDCGNHICHEGYCSKLPIYLQNILDSYYFLIRMLIKTLHVTHYDSF